MSRDFGENNDSDTTTIARGRRDMKQAIYLPLFLPLLVLLRASFLRFVSIVQQLPRL